MSPHCSPPIIPSECPEDRNLGQRLSDLILSSSNGIDFAYRSAAIAILTREARSGGNCGVKLLNNIRLLGNPDLAINLLAIAAQAIGSWSPPNGYKFSYDPSFNARGQAKPYFEAQISCRLPLLPEFAGFDVSSSDCFANFSEIVEQNYLEIIFGPGLFLEDLEGTQLRPATGDMFSTFIEEAAHAWQLAELGGLHVENPYSIAPEETGGFEYQAKAYILSISGSLISLSANQQDSLCEQVRTGYASVGNPLLVDSPAGWPNPDGWPSEGIREPIPQCGIG